jgi:aspartyl-tRNA(Asn)/glutamyl-tRNA(Gln) amidotransferase subunit A
MLNAIAGHDPRDPGSSDAPVPDYTAGLTDEPSLRGVRVGVPKQYFWESASDEVIAAARAAVKVLEGLGATAVEVDLPSVHLSLAVSNTMSWSESAAYHRDWIIERPQGYGPDVRERLQAASRILAVHYRTSSSRQQRLCPHSR